MHAAQPNGLLQRLLTAAWLRMYGQDSFAKQIDCFSHLTNLATQCSGIGDCENRFAIIQTIDNLQIHVQIGCNLFLQLSDFLIHLGEQWLASATLVHVLASVQQPQAVLTKTNGAILVVLHLLQLLAACGGQAGQLRCKGTKI